VSGGCNNASGELISCKKFDMVSKKWSFVKNMNYGRSCHGMTVLNGSFNNRVKISVITIITLVF